MPRKQQAALRELEGQEIVTWRGWAIYCWEMGYRLGLFCERPKLQRFAISAIHDWQKASWDWTDANEDVDPFFLKACGITVPFDVTGDAGKAFYYGNGCYDGCHPPIWIEIALPKPLMEQLGLGPRSYVGH